MTKCFRPRPHRRHLTFFQIVAGRGFQQDDAGFKHHPMRLPLGPSAGGGGVAVAVEGADLFPLPFTLRPTFQLLRPPAFGQPQPLLIGETGRAVELRFLVRHGVFQVRTVVGARLQLHDDAGDLRVSGPEHDPRLRPDGFVVLVQSDVGGSVGGWTRGASLRGGRIRRGWAHEK